MTNKELTEFMQKIETKIEGKIDGLKTYVEQGVSELKDDVHRIDVRMVKMESSIANARNFARWAGGVLGALVISGIIAIFKGLI